MSSQGRIVASWDEKHFWVHKRVQDAKHSSQQSNRCDLDGKEQDQNYKCTTWCYDLPQIVSRAFPLIPLKQFKV